MTITTTTATSAFDVGGMTRASCVGRIERALTKVDGVTEARVNLATEVASVTYDAGAVGLDDLAAAITKAGYTATPRGTPPPAGSPQPAAAAETDDDRELDRRA